MSKLIVFIAIVLIASAMKIQKEDSNDPQQCIQAKCPTQWATCLKDPKCQPALDDCNKKCGTKASCWALCIPGKGSQPAIDVAKCAQAQGCDKAVQDIQQKITLADPRKCIEQHCKDQVKDCRKDSNCFPALQDCEKQCQNNTSCFNTCLAKKNNPNANNLWACIVKNDCMNAVQSQKTAVALADPQQCIQDKCPNQWAACLKDPKCQPALDDCNKKCGTKASCWALCIPGKGSQPAIDVAKCAQAQGCDKAITLSDPLQCIQEHCLKQALKCGDDPQCIPVFQDCQNECKDNSTACMTKCVAKHDNANASLVWGCIMKYDCMNQKITVMPIATIDPRQCIEKYCQDVQKACEEDRRCLQTLDFCDKKCNTTKDCWNDCLNRSKNDNATKYIKCLYDHKCINSSSTTSLATLSDPQQCIQSKCPNQWTACQKDPKCIPALQDCQKKCGTKASCWSFCLPGKGSQAAIDVAKCAQANHCI